MPIYCRACVFSTKRMQRAMLLCLQSIFYAVWLLTLYALGRDTSVAEDWHQVEINKDQAAKTLVSHSPFILPANLGPLVLFRYTSPLRCLWSLLIHLNARKTVVRVLDREHNLRYKSPEPF